MTYIFFTLRDFKKVGGGSIRIHGVVNALAEKGFQVKLISGARDYSRFHPSIEHIQIDNSFKQKAQLQGLTAVLPASWVVKLFPALFREINMGIQNAGAAHSKVYFFEYLDNTIGYLLKRTGFISSYINDIHGIAPIEFAQQKEEAKSFTARAVAALKLLLARRHDRSVYTYAAANIYSSSHMQSYFEEHYPKGALQHYILPNLISEEVAEINVDLNKAEQLKTQFSISEKDTVLFFAGGYKPTSGVNDLVLVFSRLLQDFPRLKLVLIGTGPLLQEVNGLIRKLNLKDKVIQLDRVEYEELFTFQAAADIIVCPDRMNAFSDMILHLKYLDSLMSGKIVINGAFKSVLEINQDERLSVNFQPSDIDDLEAKIRHCILHKEELTERYQGVRSYVLQNLTYRSQIHKI